MKKAANVLSLLVAVYVWCALGIAWHFSWPTLKGLAWPYYVLTSRERARQKEAVHKLRSFYDTYESIEQFGRKWKDLPTKDIPKDELEGGSALLHKVVKQGQEIDIEALNRVYPELGTMFSQKLLRSLIISEQGATLKIDQIVQFFDALEEGSRLRAEWTEWLKPRQNEISAAMRQRW